MKNKSDKKKKKSNNAAEFKYQLCYDYAQYRSYSIVARKHDIHPETVKRAWLALSDSERQSIEDARAKTDDRIANAIVEGEQHSTNDIATLNTKADIAEIIAHDSFVRNIIASRKAIGEELLRRCAPDYLASIEMKVFVSLLRAVGELTQANNESQREENDTYKRMREQVEKEIQNK